MKKIFYLYLAIQFLSTGCSFLSFDGDKQAKRSISSTQVNEVPRDSYLNGIPETSRRELEQNLHFYEFKNHIDAALGTQSVSLFKKGQYDETRKKLKLSDYDEFTHVEIMDELILLRSQFGHLVAVSSQEINFVSTGFPVASFEIVEDGVNLYNLNNRGRFCSFKELRRPREKRDSACQHIETQLLFD